MSKHTTSLGQTTVKLRALSSSLTLGASFTGGLVLLALLMVLHLLVFLDGQLDRSKRPGEHATAASGRTGESRVRPLAVRLTRSPIHRDGVSWPDASEFDEVIGLAQHGETRFERLEAIADLGSLHGVETERVLRDLLHDQDPEIRDAAVESLAALGTPGAIDGLAFALLDESSLVRRSAVELLAENGTAKAIDALSVTLLDPDPGVRSSVVYELTDLDTPAAKSLLQRFLSDSDPRVKHAAELVVQTPP